MKKVWRIPFGYFEGGLTFLDFLAVTHDWATMRDAVQAHIGSLNWGSRVALAEKKVKYLNSFGKFTGSHTILVSWFDLFCKFLINTGHFLGGRQKGGNKTVIC